MDRPQAIALQGGYPQIFLCRQPGGGFTKTANDFARFVKSFKGIGKRHAPCFFKKELECWAKTSFSSAMVNNVCERRAT
jgi:hypothetical protein